MYTRPGQQYTLRIHAQEGGVQDWKAASYFVTLSKDFDSVDQAGPNELHFPGVTRQSIQL